MRYIPIILLGLSAVASAVLLAAEPATAPVADKPAAVKPAATPTKDTAADTKPAVPEPADAAKNAAGDASKKGSSPQRFVPSEQVRADFDVSFPVDI